MSNMLLILNTLLRKWSIKLLSLNSILTAYLCYLNGPRLYVVLLNKTDNNLSLSVLDGPKRRVCYVKVTLPCRITDVLYTIMIIGPA